MANKKRFAAPLLLAFAAGACVDPPIYLPAGQPGGPAGVLDGTVTYSGPLPCTENGHIVGAAVLEVFDVNLLPPPEGLGTTAASLAAVAGDVLFAGVADRLTFNDDGARWCPDPSAAPVTVSASWSAGPLSGAVYEVRGFYDLDGNFDPVITIFRVPTKGDVAGGAIDNAAAVLQGAAPAYRRIALGEKQADGTYKIPDLGSHIGGITVTLGLPLPLQPPIFHVQDVTYSTSVCQNGTIKSAPTMTADPSKPSMPSDYQLPVFSPDPSMAMQTEDSLIRLGVTAGVALAEKAAATAAPFGLPVDPPDPFTFTWQDVNGDGMISLADDHVPDSSLVPSLFPLAIFSKLADDPTGITAEAQPAVILQGLTLYKTLVDTVLWAGGPTDATQQNPKVVVGVRPAVLCLDPLDATKHAKLVLSHKTDCGGSPLLSNEAVTKNALKKQFGREVDVVEGCLPEGTYALNLVYGTGQAWTVPNEAGVCQPLEASQDGGKTCGDPKTDAHRARLPSQSVVLTIAPPSDAAYCKTHAAPPECFPATTSTQ